MEPKAKAMTLSRPSNDHFNQIKMLLAKMAIRRQAKMGETEYAVYSFELGSYSIADISAGLDTIGLSARRDGESALPDVGAVLEAIRGVVRLRKAAEDNPGKRWSAEVDEYWKQPPAPLDDELQAKVNALNEKFGMTKRKEIDLGPVEQKCPHCNNPLLVPSNIRFWTSDELRTHADALDHLHKLAQENVTA